MSNDDWDDDDDGSGWVDGPSIVDIQALVTHQGHMIVRLRAALRALGLSTVEIDQIANDGDGPA